MWKVTRGTVQAIVGIFNSRARKKIGGVVGSYEVTRQAISFDEREAIAVLAIISLSLAIINLFPFLPLDGGHIFWSLVEKVRGRPVPFRVMEQAGVIGFMLVILLFTVGLSNDIGRLSGDGFNTRSAKPAGYSGSRGRLRRGDRGRHNTRQKGCKARASGDHCRGRIQGDGQLGSGARRPAHARGRGGDHLG
jgi:hypothetical protein